MLPTTIRDGAYVPKRVKEEIDFDGPIKRGAKKMRAQRVQEFLTLNGFAVAIDADFGPATEKRVRDFQTVRGLPASGIVDMKTHEELVAPIVKALNPIAATPSRSVPYPDVRLWHQADVHPSPRGVRFARRNGRGGGWRYLFR